MLLGITAALTDQDVGPAHLAAAVEARGFSSLWLPEHTHLPLRQDVPPALVEGVRPDDYRRSLDPLIALAAAASATTTLILGTGVLLVAQHDPLLLAKQVGTLDHLSDGRLCLGVGFGWNRAEAEDHGVDFDRRHEIVLEHLDVLTAVATEDQPEFHGTFVNFDPTWLWPKPLQSPRVPVLIGGGATDPVFDAVSTHADGWLPIGGRGLAENLPRLHARWEAAGRAPQALRVVPFGTIASAAKLEHYAGLGIREVVLRIRAGTAPEVTSALDALAPMLELAADLP